MGGLLGPADGLYHRLGLEWADAALDSNTTSLTETMDALIERIEGSIGASAAAFVDQLVAHVAGYGLPTTFGYDHNAMHESARFGRRWRLRFARGYDMTDTAIRLLTTDDMRARPFVDLESLRMRVNLPDRVSGDLNPVVGLTSCAQRILREHERTS